MANWEVLVPSSVDPVGPDSITDFANITWFEERGDRDHSDIEFEKFDVIIVRVERISAAVIEGAEQLKLIAKHGAGLDNVDIDAASHNNVVVCNTPAANARSVAEHAAMLALGTRMNVLIADDHVRSEKWDRSKFANREVSGDVVGLFGFGDIAQEFVTLLRGFNISFLTYDPYVSATDLPPSIGKVSSMDELFSRSDIVSVHAPATDETHHSITIDELEKLGPNGTLINTSRGVIVAEDDLLTAVRDGVIASAGLDVFEDEPPETDHPLFELDNVILTPHIGGVTEEALERMSRQAAENVRRVYEGDLPNSTVNAEELDRRG